MKRNLAVVTLAMATMVLFPHFAGAIDFAQIVPDGRVVERNISSAENVGFFFRVVAGRSYSVTVATLDNFSVTVGFTDSAGGTCDATMDDAFVVRTENSEPNMSTTSIQGARASFIAPASQFFVACVNTASASVMGITGSASDTTIFSPAWSTNGTFETFYSLQNTTNEPINATITLLSLAGAVVDTAAAAIPAGGTFSTNTQSMATANNMTGVAQITHLGPPGSILCAAVIANFSITPAFIQNVKCEAVRESTH